MHTQRDSMYVVWMSRGMGMYPGPKFRRIQDALRYIRERDTGASFAIRLPNGRWHHRDGSGRVIFSQREAARHAA
jgi:hypothetical protein